MLQEKLAEIEECLANRRWQNHCLRANIVPKSMIKEHNNYKTALCESNTLRTQEKKKTHLKVPIESIAPEWWGDDTKISVKRNVKCERHRDGNNGVSGIIWLRDFTGGALVFDDGTWIEGKYTSHHIDGRVHHWNEPHEGTKYSIIL